MLKKFKVSVKFRLNLLNKSDFEKFDFACVKGLVSMQQFNMRFSEKDSKLKLVRYFCDNFNRGHFFPAPAMKQKFVI